MQFWKMNGAGNDFIILNNLEERLPPSAFPLLARTLCTPHRSLGADGLMVVEQAQEGADFKMLFFNSDGSLGEMCGNGAPLYLPLRLRDRAVRPDPDGGDHRRSGHRNPDRPAAVSGPAEFPHRNPPPRGPGGGGQSLALRLCGAGQPRPAPRGGPLPRSGRRPIPQALFQLGKAHAVAPRLPQGGQRKLL